MSERFRVPDDVVSEVLEGEAVLLHLRTGKYFGLNPSGTRMWALLAEHREAEATLRCLCAEFPGVAPERLKDDFVVFVTELLSRGLLVRSAG